MMLVVLQTHLNVFVLHLLIKVTDRTKAYKWPHALHHQYFISNISHFIRDFCLSSLSSMSQKILSNYIINLPPKKRKLSIRLGKQNWPFYRYLQSVTFLRGREHTVSRHLWHEKYHPFPSDPLTEHILHLHCVIMNKLQVMTAWGKAQHSF